MIELPLTEEQIQKVVMSELVKKLMEIIIAGDGRYEKSLQDVIHLFSENT